jgi:hypothetical protein
MPTLTDSQQKSFDASVKSANTQTDANTLRSEDLKGNPSFQVEKVAPSTKAGGLLGGIEAYSDAFTAETNKRADFMRENAGGSFQQYLDRLVNSKTESAIQADIYSQKGGVDDIQMELDSINSDIVAEQHSLRRELERLDKNERGLFGGALEDAKHDAEVASLRKQADMSVVQMAVQGRFDTAQRIADRAVDAEFEREEKITEAVKLNYETNKELFTKAEQRAFEVNLSNRNRALDKEKEDAQALSDAKMDALKMAQTNGAPMGTIQAIQSATSPEKVIEAGGMYAVADMLDRQYKSAQIANIAFNQKMANAKLAEEKAAAAADAQEAQDAQIEKARAEYDGAQIAREVIGTMNDSIRGAMRSSSAVGSSGFMGTGALWQKFTGAINPGEKNTFLSNLDQLKGIVSLESREALKGSGAITDTEMAIAAQAESFLASPTAVNMPESIWEDEFGRLDAVFENAQIRARYNSFTPAERAELGITLDGIVDLEHYNPSTAF